jgi:hypothetical protein
MDIKQIKLVTGEEVVCEVISEDEWEIVIRNAFTIVSRAAPQGYRFYTFRMFMVYQETNDNLIVIRQDKLVAYAHPTEDMLREYAKAIVELNAIDEKLSLSNKEADDMFYGGNVDSSSNVIPFKLH